jgi:TonB family protein
MFELKTLGRKADHPLLALPQAPKVPVSREVSQKRLMVTALALLLMALGVILYKDRDFWFPNTDAEDQLQGVPPAAPAVTAQSPPKTVQVQAVPGAKSGAAAKKVFFGVSHPPREPATPKTDAVASPVPPPSATATRTVLPPLDVEVVAGDNHSRIHPGTNSVRVDLQPGSPARPFASAAAIPSSTAASVTSNAAERVQMSVGAAEVVSKPVNPGYPLLAREMRVQGSVILQALVGRDGSIQNLHVMSGPAILAAAAEEAVRQWRFKPHYIGDKAVETQANITVNFTISTN